MNKEIIKKIFNQNKKGKKVIGLLFLVVSLLFVMMSLSLIDLVNATNSMNSLNMSDYELFSNIKLNNDGHKIYNISFKLNYNLSKGDYLFRFIFADEFGDKIFQKDVFKNLNENKNELNFILNSSDFYFTKVNSPYKIKLFVIYKNKEEIFYKENISFIKNTYLYDDFYANLPDLAVTKINKIDNIDKINNSKINYEIIITNIGKGDSMGPEINIYDDNYNLLYENKLGFLMANMSQEINVELNNISSFIIVLDENNYIDEWNKENNYVYYPMDNLNELNSIDYLVKSNLSYLKNGLENEKSIEQIEIENNLTKINTNRKGSHSSRKSGDYNLVEKNSRGFNKINMNVSETINEIKENKSNKIEVNLNKNGMKKIKEINNKEIIKGNNLLNSSKNYNKTNKINSNEFQKIKMKVISSFSALALSLIGMFSLI